MFHQLSLLVLCFFSPWFAFSFDKNSDNKFDVVDLDRRGAQAFAEGNFLEARNAWKKYVDVCGHLREDCNEKRRQELMKLLDKTRNVVAEETTHEETTDSTDLKMPPVSFEKNQPAAKNRVKKRVATSTNQKTSKQLLEEADRASENGQVEYGLRLYKMAAALNPGEKELTRKIKALEKILE